jgi:DNA-binding response OmpR family regulator
MRILVIEDHAELAETIASLLRREGMAVDVANDGEQGLFKAQINEYDVLVLDRDLPKLHGDAVTLRMIESGARSRILMLTASGTIQDRVDGLSIGADDYLSKPFASAELIARVRALSRRAQPALAPVLESGGVRLDPARQLVTRDGERLELSAKEFAVLELLMGAEGAALSTEDILARAWDDSTDPFTNVVKVIVSRLRRKLGDPPLIETVAGGRYRI